MKKNSIKLLLIVPALALSFVLYGCQSKTAVDSTKSQTETQAKEVSYQGEDGKTAFQILSEKYQVESDSSSAGVMVKSINGVSQTDKEFWLYDVNGKEPDVGADKYQTKTGDTIHWQLKGF
jgi:hypothetical protein